MQRKIVDYAKLTAEILELLVEKFPDGYNDSDIITFRNAKGEVIDAVEVRTEDTVYLVKIGVRLVQAMEEYADEEDDSDEDLSDDDMADNSDDDFDVIDESESDLFDE